MNVNVYPAQPNPTETSTIHVYIVFAYPKILSRIKVEGLGGDHRRARFLHHALLGVLEQMVLI